MPGEDVGVTIDFVANQCYGSDTYNLLLEEECLRPPDWLERVSQWCGHYPVVSLEDVLHEDDWPNWGEASPRLGHGRQLIGDDLFATDLARLNKGVNSGFANAVLVKTSQGGSYRVLGQC